MKANFDFNRLSESRKQELDRMVADFSEAGCLFVEDLFLEFLIDADNGIDRSDDKLVATFDDECGHELVFILSQEEVHYVIHAVSEKLDNIVCEGGTPFGEDENEEGIVSLSPVNTEEELDMLLAHVLGDDGGGADDQNRNSDPIRGDVHGLPRHCKCGAGAGDAGHQPSFGLCADRRRRHPRYKIGNAYRVPKINVIRYALSAGNPQPAA